MHVRTLPMPGDNVDGGVAVVLPTRALGSLGTGPSQETDWLHVDVAGAESLAGAIRVLLPGGVELDDMFSRVSCDDRR
jgi:hypothetical protein